MISSQAVFRPNQFTQHQGEEAVWVGDEEEGFFHPFLSFFFPPAPPPPPPLRPLRLFPTLKAMSVFEKRRQPSSPTTSSFRLSLITHGEGRGVDMGRGVKGGGVQEGRGGEGSEAEAMSNIDPSPPSPSPSPSPPRRPPPLLGSSDRAPGAVAARGQTIAKRRV